MVALLEFPDLHDALSDGSPRRATRLRYNPAKQLVSSKYTAITYSNSQITLLHSLESFRQADIKLQSKDVRPNLHDGCRLLLCVQPPDFNKRD
eukprot:11124-Eustigmatos_ZCMA.PRE.1